MKIEEFMHRWIMHYIRPEYFYLPWNREEPFEGCCKVYISFQSNIERIGTKTYSYLVDINDEDGKNKHNYIGRLQYQVLQNNMSYQAQKEAYWSRVEEKKSKESPIGQCYTSSFEDYYGTGEEDSDKYYFYLEPGKYEVKVYNGNFIDKEEKVIIDVPKKTEYNFELFFTLLIINMIIHGRINKQITSLRKHEMVQ